MRPVLLKEAEGESSHVVKPKSDAMPAKEETGNRYQLSGEIARGGMGAVLRGRDVDLGRDDGQAQERAVDVQITRLRRKIEADPKAPRYLQTVRGAGYMLAPD